MISDFDKRSIRVNDRIPPCYGRVRDKAGCCYSVVTLGLTYKCAMLEKAENDPRIKGLAPLFYWLPAERDIYKLFDFYAEISNRKADRIEVHVWYVDQDGEIGRFEFGDDEQAGVLKKLNAQCNRLIGKTCRKLLEEARERMNPAELEDAI